MLNEVGSYGYQLSRIIDVLNALVARVPAGELTPQEQQDIAGFYVMAHRIDAAVEEKQGPANRGVTAGDIANLTSGLQALSHTDPAQYRALLDQLHAALPDFPETKSDRKNPPLQRTRKASNSRASPTPSTPAPHQGGEKGHH